MQSATLGWQDGGVMRIHKYRAWDKIEKRWLNPDDGSDDYPVLIAVGLHGLPIAIDRESFKKKEIVGWNRDHNIILMQYTGLKDRQGKEIYEGDLLKWHEEILEVRWGSGEFEIFSKLFRRFGMPNGSTTGMINARGYFRKSEIIGNIYENPELLEERNV